MEAKYLSNICNASPQIEIASIKNFEDILNKYFREEESQEYLERIIFVNALLEAKVPKNLILDYLQLVSKNDDYSAQYLMLLKKFSEYIQSTLVEYQDKINLINREINEQ